MKNRSHQRHLGRTKNQRRALFRGLAGSLITRGEIVTTLAKANALRPQFEKLITKAKSGTLADRRLIFRFLGNRDLVNRLVDSIGTAFKDRQGGYLRLVKLAGRVGDQADMVKIMLTETPVAKPITAQVVASEKVPPGKAKAVVKTKAYKTKAKSTTTK